MKRKAHEGFTLVEVMAALAVLAIGVTGIVALQNVALFSNRRAQEITVATSIVRRWQERLREDALQWNRPSSRRRDPDLALDTQYLCSLVGCSSGGSATNAWFVPLSPADSGESAAYDAWGNEVALGSVTARFCVNLRLAWVVPPTTTTQGMIRAETRVWWYREGAARNSGYASCGTGAGLDALGSDIATVHTIVAPSLITGNPL